jgi:hypothetical protein
MIHETMRHVEKSNLEITFATNLVTWDVWLVQK